MTREQIEKEAMEYAERIPQSDERREYSREDFIAGSQWRINSVWHDAETEMPRENEPIIGITDKRWCYMGVCGKTAKEICPEMTKWAYVADLMPDREEDGR